MVKAHLAPATEFSVLVHELAHEMLHRDPAIRPQDKNVRETEAEAVAYVVCQAIGLDINSASSDYILLYNGDKTTLMASLDRIQLAAAEILEAVADEPAAVMAAQRAGLSSAAIVIRVQLLVEPTGE